MNTRYIITSARERDIGVLAAIELAAARMLVGHAPELVLKETTGLEPNAAHLEEIDVYPEHGRRGLGRRLVMQVCEWAAAAGYESVSLITFRDVPWNMPFYATLGFEVVPDFELSPALRAIVEDERCRGIDSSRRVVMRRPCADA
jgi:GNAT superfamily N-acetyltransferase